MPLNAGFFPGSGPRPVLNWPRARGRQTHHGRRCVSRVGRTPVRQGFSLVELLVVVGVIGILSGLLIPALSRARATGRAAVCASNLKQLGLASQLYWDDHRGRTFPYRGVRTNGGDVFWFGWLGRGPEGERAFDPAMGALHPYLNRSAIRVCPVFDYSAARLKLKAIGSSWGYGYNLHLAPLPSTARPSIEPRRLADPSGIILFADSAQVNTFQFPAGPDNPMVEEFFYVHSGESTVHFRHRTRAQAVFCDGHINRVPPAPESIDQRMPDQWIGRLSPALLDPGEQ